MKSGACITKTDAQWSMTKRLSLTDPQAHWTAAPIGSAFYAYSTNYPIDTEYGVIVDVGISTAYLNSLCRKLGGQSALQ
ncbi:hypothetical protein D3C76_421100 [compost metagenome]|jgi:hypothetical protein